MKPTAWQYIFFLTLVIACSYANAGAIAKRDSSSDDSSEGLSDIVNSLEQMVGSIPLVGGKLEGLIEWFVNAIELFEIATNDALSRLLGGALPCEISLTGTVCTGLSNNGGVGRLVMNVIDGVPSLILPGFIKSLIGLAIQMFIDPTMDVIFGGVVVNS